jgi:putative DNA primase/helicase
MLGVILNQNPGGVLIFRDELSGFLRSLERQGHEMDRAFYCEAWNGGAGFVVDRIGRGTLHIKHNRVSILGGIQPGPFRNYLREAFQGDRDDGFVSRFQLLVWPDVSRTWRNVDRWPDTVAKETAWRVFSALNSLQGKDVGGEQPEGSEMVCLRFADDAQALFDEWRGDLEAKLRREEEHPILVSHLAKYRKLMPALALVFHTIAAVEGGSGGFGGSVSMTAATQAAAWCDFLESHARRCYQSVTDADNTAASALSLKIRSGKLSNPFRARNVYQAGWAGLSERDDAYRAISVLEDAHWLRSEAVKTDRDRGGRPSVQFHINPKLLEVKK